jgi:hypothetical protein
MDSAPWSELVSHLVDNCYLILAITGIGKHCASKGDVCGSCHS